MSDTTSVWTQEGWLYIAIVLDLFSRLVVGWAMGPQNDDELVRNAFEMALLRRSPPRELHLHSDQGSTYTATDYLARLASLEVVVSMSAVGDCYDNAAVESSFRPSRANVSNVLPSRANPRPSKRSLNTSNVFITESAAIQHSIMSVRRPMKN